MAIVDSTGFISWTPEDVGDYEVTVEASNNVGAVRQTYTITVTALPNILSTPVNMAEVGVEYSYAVNASGNPTPVYSLESGPSGMTISSETGLVTWTPTLPGSL